MKTQILAAYKKQNSILRERLLQLQNCYSRFWTNELTLSLEISIVPANRKYYYETLRTLIGWIDSVSRSYTKVL